MTRELRVFCTVCRAPGIGLDIPVGEPDESGHVPIRPLDLCLSHLAHQVKAFLASMPHAERLEWIERTAQGAPHAR